jgi:hypothetical protein
MRQPSPSATVNGLNAQQQATQAIIARGVAAQQGQNASIR